MKHLLSLTLASAAVLSGCNEPLQDSRPQGVDVNTFPPERRAAYEVGSGRPPEVCILPDHYEGATYSKSDRDIEAYLCKLNMIKAPGSGLPGKSVAVCPKLSGTSPGLDLMDIESYDKNEYETSLCKEVKKRPTRNYAKLKFSVTCAYTGSMLAYYHVSRMLGGAGRVPVAVLRTVDAERLKTYGNRGKTMSEGTVNQLGWKDILSILTRDGSDTAKQWEPIVFTKDGKQAYGALMRYPFDFGLDDHPLLNKDTYEEFSAQEWVKKSLDPRSVQEFVGRDFESAARGIYTLKDMADMVLVDYIMGQKDRMHNIESVPFYYHLKDGAIIESLASSVSDPSVLGSTVTRQPVHRVVLRDNDCGVRVNDNLFAQKRTLDGLRHMDPVTYRMFRKTAHEYRTGKVKSFLLREATMDTPFLWGNNIDSVIGKNFQEADRILYQNCKSGKLLLDLDLNAHLQGANTADRVRSKDCGNESGEIVYQTKCTSKPDHGIGPYKYLLTTSDQIVVKGFGDNVVATIPTRNYRGAAMPLGNETVSVFQDGKSGTGARLLVFKSGGSFYLYHQGVGERIPLTCTTAP